jgi:Tol biopolymer transport system component/tRNA A-37 threonylcarbamoyl transferase component Bud32
VAAEPPVRLAPNTQLGPYEIVALIGAGGMGEVYKARDTRLDRTVAVKVLPEKLTADPAQRQRVEREARVIAGLSHPHICSLFDIGREGSIDYFVMEYLEGETLAERLARGPLPLDLVLRYGSQVAAALAAAHRLGFVHRDLKPSNIMLTRGGAKLLDFGLAELRPEGTGVLATALGTESTTAEATTVMSPVAGTLLYMAPEQLRGRAVDARADIFSLGAVLYKTVTGRRPFEAGNDISAIAAILEMDPPFFDSLLPPHRQVPASLERLIRTCLAKDPEDRWQTAQDVARELSAIAEGRAARGVRPEAGARSPLWVVAACVAIVILIGAAWILESRRARPAAAAAARVRFDVQPPPPARLPIVENDARVSPDGRHLVFVARQDGRDSLWVRPVDEVVPRRIAGTEGASQPFWSPDSASIGFHADGVLKRVALDGGAIQTLCAVRTIAGATWSPRGVILFSQVNALARVPDTGGTPAVLPTPAGRGPDVAVVWPQFLADGSHYLFRVVRGPREGQGLFAGSLDAPTVARVLETAVKVEPAGRSLLFVRSGTLMKQPFDPASLQVVGEPEAVAARVMENLGELAGPSISASRTGVLAYRSQHAYPTTITWFDRTGRALETLSAPAGCRNPELSPEGRRVAVECPAPGSSSRDLWVLHAAPSRPVQLINDPADDSDPVWSPDGRWVVFSRGVGPGRELFRRASSGAGEDEPVLRTGRTKYPNSWSRDGSAILFTTREEATGWDIWLLSSDGKREPVVSTPATEIEPQLSPDGRWLAYTSDESGRTEVYVRPFHAPGGAWLISANGGSDPRWRSDGSELFYLSSDRALMAVTLEPGSAIDRLEASIPKPLFRTRTSGPLGLGVRFNYAVAPGGQRFLITADSPDAAPSPITVVLNWDAAR